MSDVQVLILHSEDGPEWTHAVLCPADWTQSFMDKMAIEAFVAGQKTNPEEWGWDDLEPELVQRGFTVPNWHNGPNWDEDRVRQGACILTAENIHTADDCSMHGHEPPEEM